MNRWLFLLAVPYVVITSSDCVEWSDTVYSTNPPMQACLKKAERYHLLGFFLTINLSPMIWPKP
jgi:hypothetical protein